MFYKSLFTAFLFGCYLLVSTFAQAEIPEKYQSAGDPAKGKKMLSENGGVYKHLFKAEYTGQPGSFEAENVLEVVSITDTTAYVRILTYFANYHKCDFTEVFEYKASGDLIAVSQPYPGADLCVLKMQNSAGKIKFFEESPVPFACKSYCGVNGQLTATDFALNTKREIRYVQRLKNSSEYQEALRSYAERFKRN